MKKLVELGVDVNAKDDEGWTALMGAAGNDNVELLKILVHQGGADLNVKNRVGKIAQDYAKGASRPFFLQLPVKKKKKKTTHALTH